MLIQGEVAGRGRIKRPAQTGRARVGGDVRFIRWKAQTLALPSGREWQGAQSGQGTIELVLPKASAVADAVSGGVPSG